MTHPATCPACGGVNNCAMATASSAPCWCFTATISPTALEALPPAARNRACLCPRCAAGLPSDDAADNATGEGDQGRHAD